MIIAIGGQKGGAGKSTVVASLAVALHDRGERVLLVDADPQGTLATWRALGEQNGEELPELVRLSEQELRRELPTLRGDDRLVLVDLDGRNSISQRVALANADLFILPVRTGGPDIWALGQMIELVRQAQDANINPALKSRLLLNAQQGTVLTRTLRRELLDGGYLPVLDTELTQLVAFQEAIVMGSGPTRYNPTDKAAVQVRQLVRELDDLRQPLQLVAPKAVAKTRKTA